MLDFDTLQLTLEQKELIATYRDLWQQIARNEESIDKTLAIDAVNNAYEFLSLSQPNVLFFPHPQEALDYIYREIVNSWGSFKDTSLGDPIAGDLIEKLLGNIRSQVKPEIRSGLEDNLDNGLSQEIASNIIAELKEDKLFSIIWANLGDLAAKSSENNNVDFIAKTAFDLFFKFGFVFNTYVSFPIWQNYRQIQAFFTNRSDREFLKQAEFLSILFTGSAKEFNSNKYQLPIIEISSRFTNILVPATLAEYGYYIDYCHQVLKCDLDRDRWQIFYDLITECGWIFPYKNTVLICDR